MESLPTLEIFGKICPALRKPLVKLFIKYELPLDAGTGFVVIFAWYTYPPCCPLHPMSFLTGGKGYSVFSTSSGSTQQMADGDPTDHSGILPDDSA